LTNACVTGLLQKRLDGVSQHVAVVDLKKAESLPMYQPVVHVCDLFDDISLTSDIYLVVDDHCNGRLIISHVIQGSTFDDALMDSPKAIMSRSMNIFSGVSLRKHFMSCWNG
jgi:hypothetical protein